VSSVEDTASSAKAHLTSPFFYSSSTLLPPDAKGEQFFRSPPPPSPLPLSCAFFFFSSPMPPWDWLIPFPFSPHAASPTGSFSFFICSLALLNPLPFDRLYPQVFVVPRCPHKTMSFFFGSVQKGCTEHHRPWTRSTEQVILWISAIERPPNTN